MTRKEANEILEKLEAIRAEYPELKLIATVTFSKDMLDEGKIYPFITLQNCPVSAEAQADSCKKWNIPYTHFYNGAFVDSSFECLPFED